MVICKNQGFIRNLNAYDTDTTANGAPKDSLAYTLTPPRKSANSNCSYNSPYTYKKPLHFQNFPNNNLPYPFGFNLDPVSGQLKFKPTKQQFSTISYKVKEYRDTNNNGSKELIGEVYRESQVIVNNCASNKNPSITGMNCPSTSRSESACVGKAKTFKFCSSDPDNGDSVKLNLNRGTLPNSAKWSIVDSAAQAYTGKINWTPQPYHARKKPYKFSVQAKDNNCPLNGKISKQYKIDVNPIPKANYSFDSVGCGEYQFSSSPTKGANVQFQWQGQGGISAQDSAFTHQFTDPGNYPFKLTVTAEGCQRVYKDTIHVDTFVRVKMGLDTTICKSSDITVGGAAIDNKGSVTYKWHDGVTGNPVRTFSNIQTDTFMTLKVTDTICPFKDSINVDVQNRPTINLGADSQRACEVDSFLLQVDSTYAAYKWNTGDSGYKLYVDSQRAYKLTVKDTLGCSTSDSVNLITLNTDTTFQQVSSCRSYTWPVNGNTYKQSGTYYDTVQNTAYCDSSQPYQLDLTIRSISDTAIKRTVCDQYTVPSQDTTYRTSGNYTDTLTNDAKCDSIINIDLTVNNSEEAIDSVKSCDQYTWPFNGKTYQQTGFYYDTFQNKNGCDSVRKLRLVLNDHKENSINPVSCGSYKIPSGDTTYYASGIYQDTLKSAKGCDSVLTIKLEIPEFDTSILKTGDSLKVQDTGASYQWLDCGNSYSPISGATSRSFKPSSSGSYAVELAKKGCSDTSKCYEIKGLGIMDSELGGNLKVYPNPTKGKVKVVLGKRYKTIQATLTNSNGKAVHTRSFKDTRAFELNLDSAPGYYILGISTGNGQKARVKVLKD